MNEIQSKVKHFLVSECGLSENTNPEDPIFSAHLIDSLGVLILMNFLEEEFSVKLSPFEVGLEDFDNLTKIESLISGKN